MADDDLRFTPPEPKTGSHLRVSAHHGRAGDVATDAIVDDGQSRRRPFSTLAEVRAFVGESGTKASIFECGCTVVLGDGDDVRGYDPCAAHLAKLTKKSVDERHG